MKRVQKFTARELRSGKGVSRKQAKRFLEAVCPSLMRTPRLRTIVRRALRKTEDKKFADQFNAVLVLVSKLPDLVALNTVENPHPSIHKEVFQKQADGTYEKEIYDLVLQIVLEWKKSVALT